MRSFLSNTHSALRTILHSFSTTEKFFFWIFALLLITSSFVVTRKAVVALSVQVPAKGGSYSEGLIGAPKFINPVLATSQTDKDLVKLVYSGLLKKTDFGKYEPDLATCDLSIPKQATCTIFEKAKFHDGKPVTSEDVVFTINTLKELAPRNPNGKRWARINVTAKNESTVLFSLPDQYSGFEDLLTQGILPKHIWNDYTAEDIENNTANSKPIGSGPYKFISYHDKKDNTGTIHLRRFARSLNPAYISSISFNTYPDSDALFEALKKQKVAAGVLLEHKELPTRLQKELHTLYTTQIYSLFINQKNAPYFATMAHREQLANLINEFKNSNFWPAWLTPAYTIIPGTLDNTGGRGILASQEKDIQVQTLDISTSHSPELIELTDSFKNFLADKSLTANVSIFERGEIIQRQVRNREFSLLMFGTTYQHPADVYSFWHSSQRNDPGLNITNFASSIVDKSTESIAQPSRSSDQQAMLSTLNDELMAELPVIPVIQGSFQYILPKAITADLGTVSSPEERFNNINKWYKETSRKFSLNN